MYLCFVLVLCGGVVLCGGFRQPDVVNRKRAPAGLTKDLTSPENPHANSTDLTIRIKCQSAHMRSKDEVRYSKVVYGIALVPSLSR